jgi:hypothetical protein
VRAHPALVLNADFQPLSYFPLSLLSWDRAIKAVVEATHYVVEEYDTVVRSPSTTMRLPSVLGAAQVPSGAQARRVHAVQRVSCATAFAASIAVRDTRAPISRSIT